MCSVDFLCHGMHNLILEGSGSSSLEGAESQDTGGRGSVPKGEGPEEGVRESAGGGGGAMLQTASDQTGKLALWKSYIRGSPVQKLNIIWFRISIASLRSKRRISEPPLRAGLKRAMSMRQLSTQLRIAFEPHP